MGESMIRVKKPQLQELKILKDLYKTKVGSNSELLQLLVSKELRNYTVKTQDGYLCEGAVVLGVSKKPVVITHISSSKVVFSDNSCLINGSKTCHNLKLLAKCVEEFEGSFNDA